MGEVLTLGQMLTAHARLHGGRIGARDLERAMTFSQWNERACRLANALLGLGLAKGDRVAVLAYNRLEWAEIYAATAKAGLVQMTQALALDVRDLSAPERSGAYRIVSRAAVPLAGLGAAEFVVFRGGSALRDQVAVIIGDPDPNEPVPVRTRTFGVASISRTR